MQVQGGQREMLHKMLSFRYSTWRFKSGDAIHSYNLKNSYVNSKGWPLYTQTKVKKMKWIWKFKGLLYFCNIYFPYNDQ